jgi:hypothetical protein
VFLADEALRLGMIDAVGTLDSLAPIVVEEADADMDDAAVVPAPTNQVVSNARPMAASDVSVPLAAQAAAKESDMSKRIKAALYALGLVSAADASDEVCAAALSGFFRGQVPTEEAEVLKGLTQQAPPAQVVEQAAAPLAAAPNVQAAHDREIQEARRAGAIADRERRTQIEASGKLLGMTPAQIAAAIGSEDTHEAVIAKWHQEKAAAEQPVTPVTNSREGADRFAADAVDAMLLRANYRPTRENVSADVRELTRAPLSYFAKQCLALRGERVSDFADPEAVALQALQMCGVGINSMADVGAYGPSWNRPGDFPNLLSNLANKMLDQALEIAEPTYPIWTARMADLPDFKPATVIGMGNLPELDEIMDDEEIKQAQMNEELAGWIQVARYGNAVALTPVMVANDDLDGFGLALQSLAVAHEQTLNRLCLNLITGNVVMPDGVALYNLVGHGNLPAAGAGPSIAQAQAMKLLHRRQLGIGGLGRVKSPPRIALVPSAWEEAAMQTFLTFSQLNESKLPITDATINVHRGVIQPIVEPDLEDASLTAWYTFADPRIRRCIVHAFQRGYGRGGKRSNWFDPARKSEIFEVEGRFGAAAVSWRGTACNPGV